MPRTAPTADDVYARLHDLIVEGVYQPGDRLPHTAADARCSGAAARHCARR